MQFRHRNICIIILCSILSNCLILSTLPRDLKFTLVEAHIFLKFYHFIWQQFLSHEQKNPTYSSIDTILCNQQ